MRLPRPTTRGLMALVAVGALVLCVVRLGRQRVVYEQLASLHAAQEAHYHVFGRRAAHVADAVRLRPENWSFRRQRIVLSDPALTGQFAATPEYWEAVQALGEEGRYYPQISMEGIPPPYRPK